MTTEIDTKKLESLDISKVLNALDDLDNFTLMHDGINAIKAFSVLETFIKQVELIQRSEIKQVPALFKPKKSDNETL